MDNDIILLVNNYLSRNVKAHDGMPSLVNLTKVGLFTTTYNHGSYGYEEGWYLDYHIDCENGLVSERFDTKEEMMERIQHIQNVLNIRARE